MSARRLAVVTDAVYPWNTGGKERRHHELLTRLVQRGYEVEVFTMHWWDGPRSVVRDGVRYRAICPLIPLYRGDRRSILQALVFALASLRVVFGRYDVLEVDAIPFLQLYPMRAVAWIRRVSLVVTWHEYWGSDYWVEYLGPLGRLAALAERWAIGLPDRILAASQGTADRLAEQCPRADIRVVPNGVSLDDLRAVVGDAAPASTSVASARFVSAGRLLSHKNVDLALRALALLRADGTAATLTIFGDGPEADSLHRLAAELDLADAVEFTAFVSDHLDVLRAMADADAVVFPSVREGFGMVALEALAVGTPVITSDHPDNHARHLVTPGVDGFVCAATAEALADAMRRIMADPDSFASAASAAARAYDWEALADQASREYAA